MIREKVQNGDKIFANHDKKQIKNEDSLGRFFKFFKIKKTGEACYDF